MIDIYVLCDPHTLEIRYAGKAKNMAARLKTHLRDSTRRITPVCCWITSLMAKGTPPLIKLVAQVQDERWEEVETMLIAQLRADGFRLLNLADGGNQPSQTLEQRQENGRRAALKRDSTPRSRQIWLMKRHMGSFIKDGERTEQYFAIMAKLRSAAQKRPDLFGCWSNV
jgi:hypothetical protein